MTNSQRAFVLGAAHIDRIGYAASPAAGTSAPGTVVQSFGGVARNVAAGLAALGAPPILASLVGADADGRALTAELASRGIDAFHVAACAGRRTASYHAIVDADGRLLGAVADMAVYDAFTPDRLVGMEPALGAAPLVFADANLPEATLCRLAGRKRSGLFAADSVSKVKALRLGPVIADLDVVFTNKAEGALIAGAEPSAAAEAIAAALCMQGARAAVVSDGAAGLAWCMSGDRPVRAPAVPAARVDETGAGDALVAGTLFGLLRGCALGEAVRAGLTAAGLCLGQRGADLPASAVSAVEHSLKP